MVKLTNINEIEVVTLDQLPDGAVLIAANEETRNFQRFGTVAEFKQYLKRRALDKLNEYDVAREHREVLFNFINDLYE